MIRISAFRITQRKNRVVALITHYSLKTLYLLCSVVTLRFFSGRKPAPLDVGRIRSVLIIRADGLGDLVMTTPLLAKLRQIFPNSRIALLAAGASKELVEVMPVFDKVFYFDLPWFFKGRKRWLRRLFRFISEMRKERFDLTVDVRGDFRNNILMYFFGAEFRLGFATTGCDFLLTHVVALPVDSHMGAAGRAMIKYLSPDDRGQDGLKLWITDEDRNFSERLLRANGVDAGGKDRPVVTIHPGAKWDGRKWSPENYARIADSLMDRYGAAVILAGSVGDVDFVRKITSSMKSKPIEAVGTTSLRQLLALCEKSDLFLGVDSGPVHMAAAMGTKVLALFGPARREAVGPLGANSTVITRQDDFDCCPCAQVVCERPDNSCMQAITVEDVWSAVRKQLNARNARVESAS